MSWDLNPLTPDNGVPNKKGNCIIILSNKSILLIYFE